jgi:hypothetical protein
LAYCRVMWQYYVISKIAKHKPLNNPLTFRFNSPRTHYDFSIDWPLGICSFTKEIWHAYQPSICCICRSPETHVYKIVGIHKSPIATNAVGNSPSKGHCTASLEQETSVWSRDTARLKRLIRGMFIGSQCLFISQLTEKSLKK